MSGQAPSITPLESVDNWKEGEALCQQVAYLLSLKPRSLAGGLGFVLSGQRVGNVRDGFSVGPDV